MIYMCVCSYLSHPESVMVVMHLLDIEEFSRRKIHDVNVEVVFRRCGQQFAESKHLTCVASPRYTQS